MTGSITVCPSCGSHALKKFRRNWTGKTKEQTYVVPNLEYYVCPQCGETIYDREAMRKIEAHSPAFTKRRSERKSA
jgi:YgiT-type zinc finger domain-containing protein